MGDAFCYFPMNVASGFWAMQMELRKGVWGKDVPSFDGERHPWGIFDSVSQSEGRISLAVSCC